MLPALQRLIASASTVILGKEHQLRLAVACLLARGHLLIEDFPGVGKTTLAHTLANLLGLQYQRIQFTSDLMPADVLGCSVYDTLAHAFTFHPGPIFRQMILADEVNRAPPKAQSALLEAMEERQVTIEGKTYPLPEPFFVIATQNPLHQLGTFPLPESQLDRFLMRIELGFPDERAERALLQGEDRRQLLEQLPLCLPYDQLSEIQKQVQAVHAANALLDYLQAILSYTRHSGQYRQGLSPRAGLALLAGSRAWAFLQGRSAVLPEDLQAVLPAIAGHRLRLAASTESSSQASVQPLLESVAIP